MTGSVTWLVQWRLLPLTHPNRYWELDQLSLLHRMFKHKLSNVRCPIYLKQNQNTLKCRGTRNGKMSKKIIAVFLHFLSVGVSTISCETNNITYLNFAIIMIIV